MSEAKQLSVIDEEKGKATSEIAKEKTSEISGEKGTGNNCLMTFGAIGGVIMAVGVGVLTSMVVKG